MAYTSHGHHIPGTILDDVEVRPPVARCGGPKMCMRCKQETLNAGFEVQTELPAQLGQAMPQDVLTHDERVRLECLAQSVASYAGLIAATPLIIERAREFESFIIGGKDSDGSE